MTGAELRSIRKSLRMSQTLWGALTGVTRSAVCRWETEKEDVPVLVERVASALKNTPEFAYQLMPELSHISKQEEAHTMPTISTFYGIVITMFWGDHVPPHFHALYSDYDASIDIRTLEIIKGSLPRKAAALVLEWAREHQAELIKDWELCVSNQTPNRIPPLK